MQAATSEVWTLPADQGTSRTAPPAAQRIAPLACRVDDAATVVGVSGTRVWPSIREGRPPARRLDDSTIVRRDASTAPPGRPALGPASGRSAGRCRSRPAVQRSRGLSRRRVRRTRASGHPRAIAHRPRHLRRRCPRCHPPQADPRPGERVDGRSAAGRAAAEATVPTPRRGRLRMAEAAPESRSRRSIRAAGVSGRCATLPGSSPPPSAGTRSRGRGP